MPAPRRMCNGRLPRQVLFAAVVLILATSSSVPAQSLPREFRTIDGTNNNLEHPDWGSTGVELMRTPLPAVCAGLDFHQGICQETIYYADGVSAPAGPYRPSPRAVSDAVCTQTQSIPNNANASDFVWQWGQFLDHDMDLTGPGDPPEKLSIPVAAGDAFFDPGGTGTQVIPFTRSVYAAGSVPRQQINQVTAWIDASNVYGSDDARAAELRTFSRGRLKMGRRKLLPFNVDGFPNNPSTDPKFFLAGDVRSNEQNGLTAVHTLFVREHNRIARDFSYLGDEPAYQIARAIVTAEIQSITYTEFLPVLLGPNGLPPYSGYDPNVTPNIANMFSTAAYRFGHSMLSPTLLRLRRNGKSIPAGDLPLRDAFFNPQEIVRRGIEPLLRGLAKQFAQQVDNFVIDDVRNFLFGAPGSGGLDLPALNIERGRDHGLPSYNEARAEIGLAPARGFADISPDPDVQARLASVYDSVDDVDLWVGGLAEDHVNDSLVGETFFHILQDQFERLRDGDRFWYEVYLPPDLLERYVNHTRLSDIIRRNARVGGEIQDNVFVIN